MFDRSFLARITRPLRSFTLSKSIQWHSSASAPPPSLSRSSTPPPVPTPASSPSTSQSLPAWPSLAHSRYRHISTAERGNGSATTDLRRRKFIVSRLNDATTMRRCTNDQSHHRTHIEYALLRPTTRSTYGNRIITITCPRSCRHRTQHTKDSTQLLEHQVRATSRVKDSQPATSPESVEPHELRGLWCRA